MRHAVALTALIACTTDEPALAPPPAATMHTLADGAIAARASASTAVFRPGLATLSGMPIRTARWGRVGHLQDLDASVPAVAPCPVDAACAEQVVYTSDNLTEWWRVDADGWEQGWTVHARPPGDGPLAWEVHVPDAQQANGALSVRDPAGRRWRVDRWAAWDANGAPLDLAVKPTPSGFTVEVDDTGAAWPIVVDPVYFEPATTISYPWAPGSRRVERAGDVNADGFDDVMISSSHTTTGDFMVHYGSSSGLDPTPSQLVVTTNHADTLSGGGDVNGDGYADVAVHSLDRVEVFFGSLSGISVTPSVVVLADPAVGIEPSIDLAGDVNGDGYDDLAVATRNGFQVSLGGTAGLTPSPEVALGSDPTNVAWAGDLNGDGYDDLLVSQPLAFGAAGRVWLFQGSSAGLDPIPAMVVDGPNPSAQVGLSLDAAGDIDGDGYDDAAIGALVDSSARGAVQILYGSPGAPSSAALIGDSAGAKFGHDVAGAGDTNGDGYDDLVVVARHDGWTDAPNARIHLYSGGPRTRLPPMQVLGRKGLRLDIQQAATGAGDVNGDGFADLMLMSSYAVFSLHFGCADDDEDSLCNAEDLCFGPGWIDSDADGVCDASPMCTGDPRSGDSDGDGECDDLDPDLTLEITRVRPRQPFTLTVTGADPGNVVSWYYSDRRGAARILGIELGLARPQVLGWEYADATGTARLTLVAPSQLPRRLYIQALDDFVGLSPVVAVR